MSCLVGEQTGHMNSQILDALSVQPLTIYKLYDLPVGDTERGMHSKLAGNEEFW